ncbi:MAG: hypothetical protein M3R01_10265, partial [Actinomycetota bacterium]|nr:hypothetical protein [Actinomycetota bacterium]
WGSPPSPPQGQPPPGPVWGQAPPPPPGWGPGPAYPQPGYGYYTPPQTDSSAIIALVLAIASFVICPLFPAIAALFVANSADDSIRASGGAKTGDGLVKGARIVSWINIGLTAAGILVTVLLIIAAAAGSS